MRRLAVTGAALLLALTACGDGDSDAATSDDDGLTSIEDLDDAAELDPLCEEAFGYADPTASLDSIEALPGSWPDAPDGAVLCLTGVGSDVQTASYATDDDIAAVLAHYTDAVPGLELVSGEENGTGYDTLSGVVDGVGVEVRERDAGQFVLAFATGDLG